MRKRVLYIVMAAMLVVMEMGSFTAFADTDVQGAPEQQPAVTQEQGAEEQPAGAQAEPAVTDPEAEAPVVTTAPAPEEAIAAPAETEVEEESEAVTDVTGWVTEDGNKRYYYASGQYYKNTVTTIDGKRYGFDENGYLKHWLFKLGGHTYYADGDGVITTGRFKMIKGNRYYFNKYGAANMGFFTGPDGNRYYAFRSGIIRKWFFTEGGKTYYANSTGALTRNAFKTIKGKRYYFGSDGAAKTGFFYGSDGNEYFGNRDGSIRRWFFTEGGHAYYADSQGVLTKNRFKTIKGNKYYFNKYGAANMGVFGVKGTYYYSNRDGVIRTSPGRFWYKDNLYIAKTGGALYRNKFILAGGYAYYAGNDAKIKRSTFTYKDAFNSGVTLHPNSNGQIKMSEYGKLNMSGAPAAFSMETYVLVDIGDQKLYLYQNGRCTMKTSVVTGRTSGGAYGKTHGTPTGTFYINSGKTTNTHLKGLEDDGKTKYDSFVNYWMPFTWNGYGLHDATWRGSFGGSIYVTNGSHGCVNMPLGAARTVYNATRVGTMVKIQW